MKLKLDKIRKEFEDKVAVNELSLEVPNGVIYGIIGPNGAGKTTTIRMIMNITIPDSGAVLWDGKPVDQSFVNRVGYLPEERGLYKKMTVEEVIIYMSRLKDYPDSKIMPAIDPWLERVNLLDYKKKKVQELSKGMQQKLQFVTTVLHEPDIIILDEIFSGLDPLNMELIKGIILELKRKGTTILFSTHVMEQAEKLCEYVAMISKGHKVLDGRMSEVKSRFGKNSIHVEFEGDGTFMKTLPGVEKMLEFNNYYELTIKNGTDTNGLLRAIADKVTIRSFAQVEPSLYDIFIDTAKIDPAEFQRSAGGSE